MDTDHAGNLHIAMFRFQQDLDLIGMLQSLLGTSWDEYSFYMPEKETLILPPLTSLTEPFSTTGELNLRAFILHSLSETDSILNFVCLRIAAFVSLLFLH